MRLVGKLGVLLFMLVLALAPAQVSAATVDEIGKQFICQCGCNAVLTNCTHSECMVRDSMLTGIKDMLSKGQGEAQITQAFVAQYGEQVLASPPKKGFNLTAWITPFAAIFAGGAAIYFAITKWVGRSSQNPEPTEVQEGEEKEYLARVEKELSDFSDGSFR